MNGEDQKENVYTAGRAGHIRSFVLRQGRVSNAQLRYYEGMMAEIGVPYVPALHDLDTVFWAKRTEDSGNWIWHGRDIGHDCSRQSAE